MDVPVAAEMVERHEADQVEPGQGRAAAMPVPALAHRWIVQGIEWLAVCGLIGMGGSVFLGVADRYVLSLGYYWTEELARFLLIWCSLLGAAIGVERRLHFAVFYFTERFFPGRARVAVTIVVVATSSVALLIMLVKGYELAAGASDQLSPALRVPMSWVFAAVPVSALLMLYFLAAQVGRDLGARRR